MYWMSYIESAPVGSYNLNQSDISTKAYKQKVFIDNLRKIEV